MTISGIDSTYETISAINSVMAVDQPALAALVVQKSAVDAASTSISGVATKLSTLSAAASTLSDPVAFSAWGATSSDPAVVAAVSSTSPTAHSFVVSVDQIATEQRTSSVPQTTGTDALGSSGTLAIRIGSTTTNVTISKEDSLADIAAKISASGARASASVAFDGTSYTLAVRGLDTGAANAIWFSEVGDGPDAGTHSILSLGLTRPGNTTQVAQDAVFTVDGGVPIMSATNQITSAAPDVTLALTKATTGATITVGSHEVLQANITKFVDAYNDVVSSGHAGPQVTGDASVQTSLDRVASLITTPSAGASPSFPTLASIGFEADSGGLIRLNGATLTAAIASDPSGIQHLFVADSQIGSSGAMSAFMQTISQLAGNPSSLLQGRVDGLNAQSAQLGAGETAIQARLDTDQGLLHDLFVTLAAQMSAGNPPV